MRTWRRSRDRGDGRTGLTGAVAAMGLAATIAAGAVTTSVLDGGTDGRAPTRAGAPAVGADHAVPETEPSTDSTPDRGAATPRPLLRVSDGAGPAAKTDEAMAPSDSSSTTAPTGDAEAKPSDSGPSTTSPATSSASRAATTSSLTPAPIELADRTARFVTLPPGSTLPSGAECTTRVRPTAENVPENRTRNQTRGEPVTGTYLTGNPSIAANGYEARIDGDFVGSTDEIIQWAACKWGFDEDLLRAQVYAESTWYAGKLGDCGESTVPETGGCASVGLIQVRSAERAGTHHPGVYPMAWRSSALNLDYGLAVQRLCYEGLETWLGQTGAYRAGDQWNCMGRWFSGSWADGGSQDYQTKVRDILDRRPWETWVGCRDWQTNNHCSG